MAHVTLIPFWPSLYLFWVYQHLCNLNVVVKSLRAQRATQVVKVAVKGSSSEKICAVSPDAPHSSITSCMCCHLLLCVIWSGELKAACSGSRALLGSTPVPQDGFLSCGKKGHSIQMMSSGSCYWWTSPVRCPSVGPSCPFWVKVLPNRTPAEV